MLSKRAFFDTAVDTNKYLVAMRTSIQPHNYVNSDGNSQLFLIITHNKQRKRLALGIYVNRRFWDSKKQILKASCKQDNDTNLLIANVKSKANDIQVFYRLSDKLISLENFAHEFTNDLPRGNFVKFFQQVLKERKATISKATHDKELAISRKLETFRPVILFTDIDERFFFEFRNFLAKQKNKRTTRNGNIKIIKKYLRFAQKFGVKLRIDLSDIKAGSTHGNKDYLNPKEVKKCYKYFKSSFIPENQKVALGYFLFGCFTGLRFSDIMQQKRQALKEGSFSFKHVKTGKPQIVKLNKTAKSLLKHCENLFVTKYSNDHTRKLVQSICSFLEINKPVDFHMSRHTFGTNYILLGGDPVKLQILMNHSVITETMGYVHLAEREKDAEADLMDRLI